MRVERHLDELAHLQPVVVAQEHVQVADAEREHQRRRLDDRGRVRHAGLAVHPHDADGERVLLVDGALGVEARDHGEGPGLGEREDRAARVACVEAHGDHHALAGRAQHGGDLVERARIAAARGCALADLLGPRRAQVLGGLDLHSLDVDRHGHVHANALRQCDGDSVPQHRNELERVAHGDRVGQPTGGEQARLVDVLELGVARVGPRLCAGDGDHGHAVQLSVQEPRREVGGARPRRRNARAESTEARQLGVGRGHKGRIGLIASAHPGQVFVLAHGVDQRHESAAVAAVDMLHTSVHERLGDEVGRADLGHLLVFLSEGLVYSQCGRACRRAEVASR